MTNPVAQITPLAVPGQPGTVLAWRSILAVSAVAFIPLYAFFAAIVVCGLMMVFAEPILGPGPVMLTTLVGVLASTALLIAYMACYSDYLPSRCYYRWSRTAARRRADAVVDPDDPEALYIQVIPRANWGRTMLENACDVGFLRVDAANRVLLFEGDAARWVIPAGAIRSVGIEEFTVGPAGGLWGLDRHPVVVLRADAGGWEWEAPVCLRHIAFRRKVLRDRRREAWELRREIERLFENDPPA